MKIKKILSATLVFGMIAGCLTGCGQRVTVESLISEYSDVISQAESMTLDNEIVVAMTVGDSSTTMELKVDGNLKTAIVREDEENYVSKSKTNMTVSMLGMSEKVKEESYDVCEDGEITTYTKDSDSDTWTVSYSDMEGTPSQLDNLKNYAGAFELDKKTQNIGKTECYILRGTLTGNENMEEMMEGVGMDFDADEFVVNCTLYMSKDGHQPVRVEMSLDESFAGKELDFDDYTMSIDEFSFNIDISKINSTSNIQVPDEALNAYDSSNLGYDDDDLFSYPENEVEVPEVNLEETESFEVSNPNTGYAGLTLPGNPDINFRVYEQDLSYGGKMIYVLGLNTSNEDASVSVNVDFYKNGQKVDDSYRYVDMEEGCYNIASMYIDTDYDEMKFNLTKENVYTKMVGSQIDVDYTFGDGKYSGIITNNTQDTVSYPMIGFVVWGPNKEVLDFDSTYAKDETLEPGESSSFEGYYDYEDLVTDFNFYVTGTANSTTP